jgi:murein DD-endopeptidase MepM/ murein hydrolase activator NlpD
MRIHLTHLITAAVFVLGGCTAFDEMTAYQPVRAPYGQPGFQVAVGPGDTVQTLSHRYNIPVAAIVQANRLRSPYRLQAEQIVMLPPPPTYRVKDGDTVAGIATDLGVDEVALARGNGLNRPYQMRVGQVLRVPGGIGPDGEIIDEQPEVVTVPPEITPRASISAQALPPPPGVAQQPAAPPPSAPPPRVAVAMSAPPPTQRYQSLPQPSRPVAPSTSPTALAPPPQLPAPTLPRQTASVAPTPPRQTASAAPTPIVPTTPPRAAPPAPAKEAALRPPPASGGQPHFVRPVGGQVIEGFGPNGSGQNNDGINIAASAGAAVHAADAGTVIYTGNELAAFGNLILIRHAGGWVTAYGHLGSVSVQKGTTVSQGQTIGTVGQTGSVTSPQLHFEVRQGSKPVDPEPYLGGKSG